jgi:hypothetical protein
MKPKTKNGNHLNLVEPERFEAIRKEFSARGLGFLSMAAMVRKAIDEWLATQKK